MVYILDTHVFIWALDGDKKLSKEAVEVIKNTDNTLYVSTISLWEISIKRSLNKLDFQLSFQHMYEDMEYLQIGRLPLARKDLEILETLPFHHSDPFDRAVMSQAKAYEAVIITKDRVFPDYGLKTPLVSLMFFVQYKNLNCWYCLSSNYL